MKLLDAIFLLVVIFILGTLGSAVLHYDEYATVVSSEVENYTISEIYEKNPERLSILYYDREGKECRLIAINPDIVYTDSNTSIYSIKMDRNGEGEIIHIQTTYYISIKTPISPLPSRIENDAEESESNLPPGAYYPVMPKLI